MTHTHTQEAVKRLIASADATFYLVPSTNPRNTYKILWHRYPSSSRPGLAIKVDVLIPPTMNIPFVEPALIINRHKLPIMPLIPQLLLKLQCWDDHRLSRYADKRLKQYTDAGDVKELLKVAMRKGTTVTSETWLSVMFKSQGEWRVKSFVREYPETRDSWSRVGYKKILDPPPNSTSLYTSSRLGQRNRYY